MRATLFLNALAYIATTASILLPRFRGSVVINVPAIPRAYLIRTAKAKIGLLSENVRRQTLFEIWFLAKAVQAASFIICNNMPHILESH